MKASKRQVRVIPLRVKPVTAAVAAALGSLGSVSAVAVADTGANVPDELLVTATRRDASVQEVPYSITAVSQADIEKLRLRDLSDLARWTAGLYQVDQGNREANRLVMRGINASNIAAPELLRNTQGDRVGTYYGETPVYLNLVPVDINRIEVQRGPQGTLYGSRALGGNLRYIPNAPDAGELTVDARAGVSDMAHSSDTGYDADVVINVPLLENELAFRAVLGYQKRPGFIDQPFLVNEAGVSCPEPFKSDPDCVADDLRSKKDTNDQEILFTRFGLLWNASEQLTAELNFLYQNDQSGGRQINSRDSMAYIIDPDTLEPLDIGNYGSGMRFLEENERENQLLNLTLTYNADGVDVVSTTSFNSYQQKGTRDQTDLLLLYGYGDFPAFSAFTDDRTDDDYLTQEIRLVSNDPDSRTDWVVGAFWQKGELEQGSNEFAPNFDLFSPPLPDGQVTFINVTRDIKEFAIFGEVGYRLTEAWRISGGARFFDVNDEIVNCIQFTLFDPEPFCDVGGGSDRDSLFKLGTDYRFSDTLLGYALYSQGVSLGGVNPGAFVPDELRFVNPESVDNYELGVKSEWLDKALVINGAVFYMKWDDIQIDGFGDFGFPVTINAGKARTQGIELDASYRLNDNWQLYGSYSFTQGELTNDSSFGADGDRLPGFPENQGSFGISWFSALNNALDLEASYWLTTQSEVYTRLGDGSACCRDNGEALGGFTVHSASLSLSGDAWTATLYGKNLFDKYAETGVRDDVTFIGSDFSSNDFALRRYYKDVITPRIVGLELRYRFRGN